MESIHGLSNRYKYAVILLLQLVRTDFKLRYQNSFLGYLWSLLKPLFLFAIMYSVFVRVLKVNYGVDFDGVYLLLGIVIWTFFTELTSTSVGAIVGRGDLLRKLNFPRYAIVVSGAISAAINLLLNLTVVAVFMAFNNVPLSLNALLAPVLLVQLFIFCVALAFILSTLFVRLRDIGYVWDVALQALFYATPILFPVSLAPLWAQKIILLNPLAQIIQDLRYVLISIKSPTIASVYGYGWVRLIPVAITVVLFAIAVMYFKKRSKYFAEEI